MAKSDKMKTFREWYEEDEEETTNNKNKAKNNRHKRKEMRMENALRKKDIDYYVEEDDWEDYR